jgi:hypothetical protein
MSNTGSGNPEESNEAASLPVNRRIPTRIVLLGLFAIVFAVVVGSQIMGVLYAIFFPPAAPIPDQVDLISHTTTDYGTDDWLYSSTKLSACDLLHYYQSKDGECRIAPITCPDDGSTQPAPESTTNGQNVARCTATQNFSIFALRWEVIIATGATSNELSQFRLSREIYWTGAVPPSNPPTLDGGFPQAEDTYLPPTSSS